MSDSDFVRARDKDTGHHHSIRRGQYDANPEAWELLKQDATYSDGTPLPSKFKTSVDQKAADNKGGQTADQKEK